MRIYTIVPGVLQSARTHQLADWELRKVLRDHSITAVANLWHTADERARALCAPGGLNWYEHESIPDGRLHDWMIPIAHRLADRTAEEVRRGGGVLVHCWGGRNRSGLVSALAAMRLTGCSGARAVQYVQDARRGSLSNVHFRSYLEGLSAQE